MKFDQASRTASIVCMARALAHGMKGAGRFRDPTALRLLGESERQRVERLRAGVQPRGLVARLQHVHLSREASMIVARTIAVDDAVREAPTPQLVILGAGLDGRAWRMGELGQTVVFEVDHPASQREKRSRAEGLKPIAREVRFVPVDFAKDDLSDALVRAGHDTNATTTWIWEGVVAYLDRGDIESTLRVVEARSTPRSRLVIVYHQPALMLIVLSLIVRRFGEPIRTALTERQMRKLLEKHGFEVQLDEDLPTIGARLSREVARATKIMRHLRVVKADRRLSSSKLHGSDRVHGSRR